MASCEALFGQAAAADAKREPSTLSRVGRINASSKALLISWLSRKTLFEQRLLALLWNLFP